MDSPRITISRSQSWSSRYNDYSGAPDDDSVYDDDYARPRDDTLMWRAVFPNVWFVTTIVLLVMVIRSSTELRPSTTVQQAGSYQTGFDNELDAPKAVITLKKQRFTNAIRATENGTLYPYSDPSQPRYVGFPSPAIDEAWHELLHGRYTRFTEAEVALLNADTDLPPLAPIVQAAEDQTDGFYGGPDVLHSLHCLNAVRKHLDMDYYKNHMSIPVEYRRMHIDHCLDQLRQAVMCHGDLTPVTLRPVLFHGETTVLYYLGETERVHTCRDTSAIREWVTRRGNETGALTFE